MEQSPVAPGFFNDFFASVVMSVIAFAGLKYMVCHVLLFAIVVE